MLCDYKKCLYLLSVITEIFLWPLLYDFHKQNYVWCLEKVPSVANYEDSIFRVLSSHSQSK
jgi:hypothetical protein